MDYLTNYYKNLSEQLQEQINILESAISRFRPAPDFGGAVGAYTDSAQDPTPNVATRTNDEEALRVDTFGGRYPDIDYARADRAISATRFRGERLEREADKRYMDAQKEYLSSKKYRGNKSVFSLKPGAPTRVKAEKEFHASYKNPQEIEDQLAGQLIMMDLNTNILKAHPKDAEFLKAEKIRIDRIMGRDMPGYKITKLIGR